MAFMVHNGLMVDYSSVLARGTTMAGAVAGAAGMAGVAAGEAVMAGEAAWIAAGGAVDEAL